MTKITENERELFTIELLKKQDYNYKSNIINIANKPTRSLSYEHR